MRVHLTDKHGSLVGPQPLQVVMPVVQLPGFSQCVVKLLQQSVALGDGPVRAVQEIVLHVLSPAGVPVSAREDARTSRPLRLFS